MDWQRKGVNFLLGKEILFHIFVYLIYYHMFCLTNKLINYDKRLRAIFSIKPTQFFSCFPSSWQNEIEILKAENDRLKAETGNTAKPTRPPSESSSSTSSSSSRQSLGLSLNNLNITEAVTSGNLVHTLAESQHAHKLTDGKPGIWRTLHTLKLKCYTLILRNSPILIL